MREDADGVDRLSYEQAVERAAAWFDSPEIEARAARSFPIGPTRKINYQRKTDGPYTIGDALIEYFEWKELVATEASYLTLLASVNLHAVPRLADIPAESVNGEHVRAFVRDMLETPAKYGNQAQRPRRAIESYDDDALRRRKTTINKMMSVLRKALEMAWENGRINNDRPWRCFKHIRMAHRPRILHLSRLECRELLAASPPDLQRIVKAALYTGCRFTELIRMRVSHVGKDGFGVYVTPVKTYKPRFVFLSDEGMTYFLDLIRGKAPGELVFVRDNGHLWRYSLRHLFKAAIRAAKLPDEFTFHGLRHTYASQLVQSGAPLIVVADQLGHANTNTVSQTYGHLSPQIRESEVRQRFTVLDETTARKAKRNARRLAAWRNSLHGGRWRTYATIHDLKSADNEAL
jgi:integrase